MLMDEERRGAAATMVFMLEGRSVEADVRVADYLSILLIVESGRFKYRCMGGCEGEELINGAYPNI